MNLIVTDTFEQVNGASTTYKNILRLAGEGTILHPGLYKHRSASIYPEMQNCTQPIKLWNDIYALNPQSMHIATEGIMGLVARMYCSYHSVPYTTAYHTKFPEFLKALANIPLWLTYAYLRWFHKKSLAVLTTTQTMCDELTTHGIKNAVPWTRGVDTELLGEPRTNNISRVKPVLLYVGRVSKEKNLDVFCNLNADEYTLQIVGDGPYRAELISCYPHVEFLGYKHGRELGDVYANADCFVFTSLTDTFGMVMIEAMSMGTPVAAFPVTGPIDAVTEGITGYCNKDLNQAIDDCMLLNRLDVTNYARQHWTWDKAYRQYLQYIPK